MDKYYYIIENEKIGPFNSTELINEGITSNSLVWKKGLENWVKACNLAEINSLLNQFPPPVPNTVMPPIPNTSKVDYGDESPEILASDTLATNLNNTADDSKNSGDSPSTGKYAGYFAASGLIVYNIWRYFWGG